LALVKLSDESNIGRLETPFGLLRTNAELEVETWWAVAKIGDRNLLFTFQEGDRAALEETTEKQLVILRKQLGEEILDTSALCGLLLPKAKKTLKKKTTKKTSSALSE
jgi:hypothetical protein|tara:strand:+ start:488 stop:811 length:324 start_codon:yes stop_codon:yes gene_type:complete